jgi:HD-GYP domain-containing protein (c-di-GMP phosphodiesterase class II)
MARLEVIVGFHAGRSFSFTDEVSLGRSPDNAICLPEKAVSRHHARIERQRSRYAVVDLNSTNGVILRGQRILPQTPRHIFDGDEIWIGSTRLVFCGAAVAARHSGGGSQLPIIDEESCAEKSSMIREFGDMKLMMLADDSAPPSVALSLDASRSLMALHRYEQDSHKGLQEALKRLQAVCQVGAMLGAITDREKLLQRVMDGIFEIFPAVDRAFILLKGSNGDDLVPVAAKKRQATLGDMDEVAISQTIVNEVVQQKRSILSFDALRDDRFSGQSSVIDLSIRSMMCAPLLVADEILGLIQIDNCTGRQAFASEDLQILTGISAPVAIAIKNAQLVEDFKSIFDALIELIATAIDEKSPYTGGHCRRVPVLTQMLAEAACQTKQGPLYGFTLSDEELYELKVAALLHDCGKVTTPVHIVDKSTKLEKIFDRMQLVEMRAEVLKRDAEIEMLRTRLELLGNRSEFFDVKMHDKLIKFSQQVDEDLDLLRKCNGNDWFISTELQQKIEDISHKYRWVDKKGIENSLLSKDELYNLTIPEGTLTSEEREIINAHVVATIKMLEALPYPKSLRNVPTFAGVHHERMDGKGYPKGLTKDAIPMQGRILALADIFEALTAKDRPYKKGKTLMESLRMLGLMKLEGHIDPDLFDVFINEHVYLRYAKECLDPEQVDEVIVTEIPGYLPPA